MVFVKGQSGNPGGMPKKDNELVRLAKAKTPEAFKALIELLQTTSEDSVRMGCIKTVFEYGFGKPRQEMEVTGKDGEKFQPILIIGKAPDAE